MEANLTEQQLAQLGGRNIQWTHEATRQDGAMLFTSVNYNHATRGTWKAALAYPDGRAERLLKLPRVSASSKGWTLTPYGKDVREEGRS